MDPSADSSREGGSFFDDGYFGRNIGGEWWWQKTGRRRSGNYLAGSPL
jgi:hypothetical protein